MEGLLEVGYRNAANSRKRAVPRPHRDYPPERDGARRFTRPAIFICSISTEPIVLLPIV